VKRGRFRRFAGRVWRRWLPSADPRPLDPDAFSGAELEEFLEGDEPAGSPEFRERLRRSLWARLERGREPPP